MTRTKVKDRGRMIEDLLEDIKLLKRSLATPQGLKKGAPHITSTQWIILSFLKHTGSGTIKDIARHLHTSSSAATQVVNIMVEKHYLVKKTDPSDRRAVILTLSRNTDTHIEKMKKETVKRFLHVFQALTDEEFAMYHRLNKKLIQGLLSSDGHSLKNHYKNICYS